MIATGASPFVPAIKDIETVEYLTSDTLWQLKTQPKRLIVLGGGPIGSELTQAFNRLGSEVWLVEREDKIMDREDSEISEMVREKFVAEGVHVMINTNAVGVETDAGEKQLVCEQGGDTIKIAFDEIIIAVGRKPNTSGFGAEELGISLNPKGTIATNEYLQTDYPNIYAVGDVAGPYQFTHTSSHQAWYAAVNSCLLYTSPSPRDRG